MRKPPYYSPTQLKLFDTNRQEYYVSYLADNRPPRLPQTKPMAIGSAFDAFCKSYLNQMLYGKVDPLFEITTLFETQVEPHNRSYSWKHGRELFESYKRLGALANLMIELDQASEPPRFEFTIQARVPHEACVGGIEILGKPDVYFVTRAKVRVIYDWKVNGYFGTRKTSPKPGYIKILPDGFCHKNCLFGEFGGLKINTALGLENVDEEWAAQLTTYAWLVGEPCGAEFVAGIEQITSDGRSSEETIPTIRVASHRYKIAPDYQRQLLNRYARMHNIIESGHIFDNLPREESDKLCAQLDDFHKAFVNDGSEKEQWFTDLMRQHNR